MENMETIVGIDLGTTNSEISFIKDGQPIIIPIENESIMPSCVGINSEGKLIVGQTAKNQIVSNPESTIFSIKRSMGEDTKIKLGNKEFLPEEISSFILLELKKYAEKYLGKKIEKAVITVPAYFSDVQRKATKDAGILAGLDIVRIINEPTAAAVAYNASHEENHKILVYDLGGGTFDVSIVCVEDGIVEVMSSNGDTQLGGDDFDEILINYICKDFKEKNNIDLKNDLKTKRRLKIAVEKAKCYLSEHPFAKIKEEFIYKDLHLDIEISREKYEEMLNPLLEKTLECINTCMQDALLLPKAIDKIILVGGSTRTPLVHKIIKEKIGIEPNYEISPDLIVAMGAAIQGGVIAGQKTNSILVDITPYTFGTSAVGDHEGEYCEDKFVPLIYKNSPIPVSKEEVFYKMYEDQDAVDVKIYQGEAPLSRDNILIGNFLIEGLNTVSSDNQILLNLALDINGILKVTATEKATGLSKIVTMDTKSVQHRLNLESAKKNIASLIDEESDADINASNNVIDLKNNLVFKAKNIKERAKKIITSANEEDINEIENLLKKSKTAILEGNMKELELVNESLENILFYMED